MSEGPIKRWRDSYKPLPSTPQSRALHAAGAPGHGYCGRKTTALASTPTMVTCADCIAAQGADDAAKVLAELDQRNSKPNGLEGIL